MAMSQQGRSRPYLDRQPIDNTRTFPFVHTPGLIMVEHGSLVLGILIAQSSVGHISCPSRPPCYSFGNLIRRRGAYTGLLPMNLRLKTGLLSIWISGMLTLMALPCRVEALDHTIIRQVVTKSEEGASAVIIQLSGHPAYKVIPIEDREMLIAFKDTSLFGGVCTSETIFGDELIQHIDLDQRPSNVTCLLVRLHRPYTEIGHLISESNGILRIEIRGKARGSRENAEPGEAASLTGKAAIDDLLKVEWEVSTPDTELFLKAAQHYKMGRWENVTRILRNIIQSYPESRHLERAYFLLAKSFHHMFEKEMSRHLFKITQHYNDAIKKFPGSNFVPDAMVSIGNCYFKVKNYYEALAYYNLVLENNKSHPAAAEALFQRGKIFVLTKRPQEAIRSFDDLGKLHHKTRFAVRAKIEMAKILFRIKSFKRSVRALNEVITMVPDEIYKNPEILLHTGYSYYELGQLREARDVFSRVLNCYPDIESNHLVLARIADTYREQGMEDKACKLYNVVIRRYPDTNGSLIGLLRLAEGEKVEPERVSSIKLFEIIGEITGDSRTPREIYEQIIEKHADNPISQVPMLKLAYLQQKDKDYDQSVITLEEMMVRHPQTPLGDEIKTVLQASLEAIFERERQAGKIENIISYYERIKPILPIEDIPNLLLLVGDAYRRLRLYEHGLSMFKKARGFYADQDQPANLLFGLGECSYKIKRFDEAERALKAFVARYPEHRKASKAHYWMGNIFLERKEHKKALKPLSMALRQKGDKYHQVKVLMAMADASNGQGDHGKAARSLREAITLLNQDKSSSSRDLYDAYRELGETCFKLGQNTKAVSAFEKALRLSPEGSQTHGLLFRLAQCYQRLEATDKAEGILNRIISSGDPFWSRVAQAQINEIKIKESVEKFGDGLKKS